MKTVSPPVPLLTLYHLSCRKCHAVLEVQKDELRAVDEQVETLYVLTCPHCQRETWFSEQSLAKRRVRAKETP